MDSPQTAKAVPTCSLPVHTSVRVIPFHWYPCISPSLWYRQEMRGLKSERNLKEGKGEKDAIFNNSLHSMYIYNHEQRYNRRICFILLSKIFAWEWSRSYIAVSNSSVSVSGIGRRTVWWTSWLEMTQWRKCWRSSWRSNWCTSSTCRWGA